MNPSTQAAHQLKAFNASLSDACTERFARETREGLGLHALRRAASTLEALGGYPSMAFDWPSYFKPMKAPNLTRADAVAYVAEALEADQAWVASSLKGLIDEIMNTGDLLMTLIIWLPDCEWWKAFDLISESQRHHSAYLPQAAYL